MASFVALRPLGRRLLLGAPLALAPVAARAQDPEIKFQRSSLVVVSGGRDIKFEVELALNDTERARGLMFRKQLGPYEGMLFDFYKEMPGQLLDEEHPDPARHDLHRRRRHGEACPCNAALPLVDRPVPSRFPVRAVLEINGGSAALLGIKPGDKVRHPIFGNA
jgi:uncharacterized membrane protein (UPF0127 family)